MLRLLLHLSTTMTFFVDLESDGGYDDDNEVELVNVPEDDRKPAAKTDHDNNIDELSGGDSDVDFGLEEDELDEDSVAVNDAITQFLFEYENFYVDEEDDYRGDHDGLDNTVIGGGPKKPDCLHMTAKKLIKL